MIRAYLLIQGRVQGVGFRSNTRHVASKLGLKGWVRNLRNGDVEAVVEGPENDVQRLITWCHRGPTSAYVSKVSVDKTAPTGGFSGFIVKKTL